MELYVEDFLQRQGIQRYDRSYLDFDIDIAEERGYDDYSEKKIHQSILEVLKQFALIDPHKIMATFRPTPKQLYDMQLS